MGEVFSSTFYEEAYKNLASNMDIYFQDFKNNIISEETIELIKSNLLTINIDALNTIITEALEEINHATVNIAVTGESGSGKDSFINALQNVRCEGQVAAIGVGGATMEPTAYKHPKFPNVIFWDFPDIETTNLQPREYLEKVTFCEYDFFMIVSATHFKESDVQLAKAIQQMKKNFYFIRYKVDIDMQNEQRCNPTNFDRGKVLQQIQDNCLYPLKQIVMDELQIFLVSGDDLSEYDFPILVETLLKDLSTQKRHILVLSLPSVTEEDIERKKNSLKQMIWLKAVKDDLSTLRIESIFSDKDIKNVKERINKYRHLFGVDDASLQNLAQNSRVPMDQLKTIIKSPNLLEGKEDSITEIFLTYLNKFLLAAGSFIAAHLFFKNIYYLEWLILDTVTNDAKLYLEKKRLLQTSQFPIRIKSPES